jgi:predicted outer membrane repeat protein
MIRIVGGPALNDLGVRLSLLGFADGRSIAAGGAAVRIVGADNVQLAGCAFHDNEVSAVVGAGGGAGGAVSLAGCHQILVEDCVFFGNTAEDGGALYAEDCQDLVVTGGPLAPAVAETFAQFLADPDATRPAADRDPLLSDNYASRFDLNRARGSGGGLLLTNTTFRLENCAFTSNRAGVAGGAVAAYADDAVTLAEARGAIAAGDQVADVDHTVQSCLIRVNHAPTGAAVALGGRERDLRLHAEGGGTSAGGGLFELVGNLVVDNALPDMPPAEVCSLGAGLSLASGVFTARGNRISGNRCRGYGGAVAALGNARVELIGNVIDRNGAGLGTFPDPPGDLGVPGGGAVFAHGFGGEADPNPPAGSSLPRGNRTVVRLLGNTIRDNQSFRDGAGVLATSGAIVVVGNNPHERLTSATTATNVFQGNSALWNGGAISIRNADLEIWAGESFLSNEAARDGGALFVGGTIVYLHAGDKLFTDANLRHIRRLPSARGARLVVAGSTDEPVTFAGNRAGAAAKGHGGALFCYQQPVAPFGFPPVANFSVGLLRWVDVRHARFTANRSQENAGGTIGSTIATLGLDHGWRSAYSGIGVISLLDEILGGQGLGPYALEQLDLTLDRGIGIYLVNSQAADIELRFQADNVIRHSAGAPEGQGWESMFISAGVTRPMEP